MANKLKSIKKVKAGYELEFSDGAKKVVSKTNVFALKNLDMLKSPEKKKESIDD